MAERVNRNVEWVTDDDGNVTGYQRAPGDVVSMSPAVPVRTNLNVVMFGDSTGAIGALKAATTDLVQTVMDQAIPGGTTTTGFQQDKYALSFYYPAAKILGVAGIAGETTTNMLARDTLAVSASRRSIFDAVDLGADVIYNRGLSVNDISGFTAATPQSAIDDLFARHMQIIDTATATGTKFLDTGGYGFDHIPGQAPPKPEDLAFIRAAIVQVNARVKSAVAGRSLVRFLDTAGLTHDGKGAFLPGASIATDGTHISAGHQFVVDRKAAKILTEWFGPSSGIAWAGANLAGSAAMFHTKTAIAGVGNWQTGYGWSTGGSNVTRRNADILTIGEKRWSVCEGVPTGANPTLVMTPTWNMFAAGNVIPIVAGSEYGIEMDVFLQSLDGNPLGAGATITSRLELRDLANTGRLLVDWTATALGTCPLPMLIGKVVVPRWRAPVDTANLGASTAFTINFFGRADGSQAFRAGISSPRFVKLS